MDHCLRLSLRFVLHRQCLARDIIGPSIISSTGRGRIFNRAYVATLIDHVFNTQRAASERKTSDSQEEGQGSEQSAFDESPPKILAEANRVFWDDLMARIEKLRDSLLRKDADAWVPPGAFSILSDEENQDLENQDQERSGLEENAEVNAELARMLAFRAGFDKLMHQCKIHKCASMLTRPDSKTNDLAGCVSYQ